MPALRMAPAVRRAAGIVGAAGALVAAPALARSEKEGGAPGVAGVQRGQTMVGGIDGLGELRVKVI